MMFSITPIFVLTSVAGLGLLVGGCQPSDTPLYCSMWIDVVRGEPVTFADLTKDLKQSDVIYLGERHTVDRHHRLQCCIVDALGENDRPLVIALEQLEASVQPRLDQYADGKITFEQLAGDIDWERRWSNYRDYRPILEAGRRHGARFLALNAPSEIIRQVGREGLESLSPEQRAQLPREIDIDDRIYADHLKQVMGVMIMARPGRVDRMIAAQMTRDEMMANVLAAFLSRSENKPFRAVVICGSGHVNYGLGTAQRMRRRCPHLRDRILVLSACGDVTLSPAAAKMARSVKLTHAQMRKTPSRIGDYLHVVSPLSSRKDRKETP